MHYILLIFRDICVWFTLHMIAVYFCHKLPDTFYAKAHTIFQTFNFEKNGAFYQRFFHIKKWKSILPDGGSINRYGFEKQHLSSLEVDFLEKFHLETKRAELIHIIGIASSLIFILLHSGVIGYFIFFLAALTDIPFIMIQRYNRPRLYKLIQHKRS